MALLLCPSWIFDLPIFYHSLYHLLLIICYHDYKLYHHHNNSKIHTHFSFPWVRLRHPIETPCSPFCGRATPFLRLVFPLKCFLLIWLSSLSGTSYSNFFSSFQVTDKHVFMIFIFHCWRSNGNSNTIGFVVAVSSVLQRVLLIKSTNSHLRKRRQWRSVWRGAVLEEAIVVVVVVVVVVITVVMVVVAAAGAAAVAWLIKLEEEEYYYNYY